MEIANDFVRLLFALGYVAIIYILPVAILAGARLRSALDWRSQRWRLRIAEVLVLPHALVVWIGMRLPDFTMNLFITLSLLAALLYWRAIRGYRGRKLWLEGGTIALIVAYIVNNAGRFS